MTNDAASVTDGVVAAAAAAAVIYFCFTAGGRERLHRFEQWLDQGERETGRMLDTIGRVTALADTVTDAVRPLVDKSRDVARFPSELRRTGRA